MTNRYEDAMNALTRLEDILGETFIGSEFGTIRHALQLAQETEQLRLKLSETAIHLAARNSEIEQLRKERDELARAIIKIHEDQEGDYDFLKFISRPQYILAKKAAGE